jgi:putative selenate reductase
MSDRFRPLSMEQLTAWVFDELERKDAIFGIPRKAFFRPTPTDPFRRAQYGQTLDTPFGVAAGPHSQLAQNIIVAWLCGARFIELKTVQTLDELEISKPCIDMQDEGYNCEWSQELKVHESYAEYLRAWVLIHALHRKLGLPGDRPGIVFNLSVGYNLQGIQNPNVQDYLRRVRDTAADQKPLIDIVAKYLPEVRQLQIPSTLSDNITLSTMHGCPPAEIESISKYLLADLGFHTSVKLNPTLLGAEGVRGLLNTQLGFDDVTVPDEAFGHDLKYVDAVPMLTRLRALALERGLTFGVKLTNTLEVVNHRNVFPANEKTMYLSGRPLQAISSSLAAKLSAEFDGDLPMSYAGGADAFFMPGLLSAGMKTITVCSDILKSGGYLRMLQYMRETARAMDAFDANDLDAYVVRTAAISNVFAEQFASVLGHRLAGPFATSNGVALDAQDFDTLAAALTEAGGQGVAAARLFAKQHGLDPVAFADDVVKACARLNLQVHADAVTRAPTLHKSGMATAKTKTPRKLGLFDCVEAPCVDECPIDQKVPQYMRAVREGRFADAVEVMRKDSAIPTVLGRICDRKCQDTCIRSHYDDALAIREVKRFVMAQEHKPAFRPQAPHRNVRVAIVGAGPCGLTAASYLAQAGYTCTVFEQFEKTGGMVSGTIPIYRLPQASVDQDIAIVQKLGVEFRFGQKAGRDFMLSDLRQQGFEFAVVATGAQVGKQLGLVGEDAEGVMDAIWFLRQVRDGAKVEIGPKVLVVGAGDVAIDAARTAHRLGADVTVAYRRTMDQAPADPMEVQGLLEEGLKVAELVSPKAVHVEGGKSAALICHPMKLGERGKDGRREVVPADGDDLVFPTDAVLLAVSQRSVLDFFGAQEPELSRHGAIHADPTTLETSVSGVYAGGDTALDGPSSAVKACADGKTIAAAIRRKVEGFEPTKGRGLAEANLSDLVIRRAHRTFRVPVPERPVEERQNFGEVILQYSEEDARAEAERCLDCDQVCSLCVSVCPNLAFLTYQTALLDAQLPGLVLSGGKWTRGLGQTARIDQQVQVAVLTDFCNECGNCTTFCPTSGTPYKDKPRLYLHRADFEAQQDNAFMLFRNGTTVAIQARFGGQTHEVVLDGAIRYRTPQLTAAFDPATFALQDVQVVGKPADGLAVSLQPAVIMTGLLRGLSQSMPHLPAAPDGPGTPFARQAGKTPAEVA